MTYDTFIFADEVELLKLRLTELWDVVDKFVFVEARENHRGKAKPLFYSDNLSQFDQWKDKIHCFVLDYYEGCIGDVRKDNMHREHLGREHLGRYPYDPGSVIVFSDADEICRPEVISNYRPEHGIVAVEMMFTHYFFNCLHPETTKRTTIAPMSAYVKHGFDMMRWRESDTAPVIPDGGWHHSYLGGLPELKAKILGAVEGCSSDWIFKEPDELIASRIAAGQLYNGAKQFTFFPVDNTLSKYVQDNQAELTAKGLIKEFMRTR